jgi:hypothetical protein
VSDDIDVSGEEPIAPEGEVAPPPAPPIIRRGALSRNVLLIVAGVIVVAVAVAFVFLALQLGSNTTQPTGTSTVPITTPSGGSSGGVIPSTVASGPLPDLSVIGNNDVFTPKNPFVVIQPVAIPQPTTSTVGSHDTSGTLYCTRIIGSGASRKAVVRLDGVTYTLGNGEQVDSSAYSIVTVYATDVLVQYGDVQFTIKPQSSSSDSGS